MAAASIADGSNPATYQTQSNSYSEALYDFLGQPNRQAPVDRFSHRGRTNMIGLQAYEGRNALLSDTIVGLVLSDNEAQTKIFMPWVETDEMSFEMKTIELNRALPGPTPHEGTSRLITSSVSAKTFTSQRYGIKHRMEGGFASTAQGKQAYVRNMVQMTQAIQELAVRNYLCLYLMREAILFADFRHTPRSLAIDAAVIPDSIIALTVSEIAERGLGLRTFCTGPSKYANRCPLHISLV